MGTSEQLSPQGHGGPSLSITHPAEPPGCSPLGSKSERGWEALAGKGCSVASHSQKASEERGREDPSTAGCCPGAPHFTSPLPSSHAAAQP